MTEEAVGGIKNARGAVVEVWQDGQVVGCAFDWQLSGGDGQWEADALKQSFSEGFTGGEVELRFLLTATSQSLFQLRGIGECFDYVTGERRRALLRVKGTKLWAVTAELGGDRGG